MEFEKKALYNLIRMNWMQDPQMDVQAWQVCNYRELENEALFSYLSELGYHWSHTDFIALSGAFSSPEEMADSLSEEDRPLAIQDYLYLLVFELWRRYLPENQSSSIFFDELDHQINLYDGEQDNPEELQDLLDNFLQMLDETTDEGMDPQEAFAVVERFCANDIAAFVCDFISEQIDSENTSYAQDLIEGFERYLSGSLWIAFFKVRILNHSDPLLASDQLQELLKELAESPDLEMYFEVLNFMLQDCDHGLFLQVVQQSFSVLEKEEDFQELLEVCLDYFQYNHREEQARAVEDLLKQGEGILRQQAFSQQDSRLRTLTKIIDLSPSVS